MIEPNRKNLKKISMVSSLNRSIEYKNATSNCQNEANRRNIKMIFDRLFFLNKTSIVIPIHKGIQVNNIKNRKNI